MRSKDILKQALIKYDGTLIVVSHDRDFLDGLVKKVYEFKHRKIKENIGGIYDFLRKKKIENLRDLERKDKIFKESQDNDNFSDNKKRYIEKKEYDRNLRKLTRRVEDMEKEIEELEKEIELMDNRFSDPDHTAAKDESSYNSYNTLKKSLTEKMGLWSEYTHELEMILKSNS
jgi:ATP-binding cassette subfamily F protein 3